MTQVLLLLVRGVWVTGTNISPYQWYILRLCVSCWVTQSWERSRVNAVAAVHRFYSGGLSSNTSVSTSSQSATVRHAAVFTAWAGPVLRTAVISSMSIVDNAFFFCWKIVYETINVSDMIDSVTALTVWIVTSCSNVLQFYVVGVLPKSTNPKHIEENAQIFDFQLSDDQMSRLTGINCNVHYCWDPSSVLWGDFISVFLCASQKQGDFEMFGTSALSLNCQKDFSHKLWMNSVDICERMLPWYWLTTDVTIIEIEIEIVFFNWKSNRIEIVFFVHPVKRFVHWSTGSSPRFNGQTRHCSAGGRRYLSYSSIVDGRITAMYSDVKPTYLTCRRPPLGWSERGDRWGGGC